MPLDPLQDPEFLTSLRRDMLRFAEIQLRDKAQAEDAVQEALTGALLGREKFASRASLRTWVLSILKNKIIDALRRKGRENAIPPEHFLRGAVEPENGPTLNSWFDDREHWTEDIRPSQWPTLLPATALKQSPEIF